MCTHIKIGTVNPGISSAKYVRKMIFLCLYFSISIYVHAQTEFILQAIFETVPTVLHI